VQQANGLVTATNSAALLVGWAVAAALLTVVSVGSFFAVNAGSYFVSAALIARTRSRPLDAPPAPEHRPMLAGGRGMGCGRVCAPRSRCMRLGAALRAAGLGPAITGTFLVGVGTGAAFVLLTSATQESVDENVLGRAMGVIFLGSFGAKPVGLLLIAPLYAFLEPCVMFVAGGVALFACALVAAGLVDLATRRYRAAAAAA
jgi:hypothetical protein